MTIISLQTEKKAFFKTVSVKIQHLPPERNTSYFRFFAVANIVNHLISVHRGVARNKVWGGGEERGNF